MSIAEENRRRGSDQWWQARHAPPAAIEGYATEPSVVAGDPLALCVSTRPAARYRVRVFRLGWYDGLGGREIADAQRNVGLARAAPAPDRSTGIVRASWPVTDLVATRESWRSGQYAAVLELTSGPAAGTAARVPFVVRALPGDPAPVLVQTPVNTTQAYNHWGGKSLYQSNSSDEIAAVKVSFDRPVPSWELANLNARSPFVFELPLIRWLEREGIEASYATNVDTHRHPYLLSGRRLVISAGHDEYWTREIRDAFDRALADGTNLAFMGANTCYWQIRYEDSERTIVAYRVAGRDPEPDPARKTVRFRELEPQRAERALIGQQYDGGRADPRDQIDYRFADGLADDPWAAGIELCPEQPLRRLVGYEWDTFDPARAHPSTTRILHGPATPVAADCIRFTARSGATVLSAGSLRFAWGLDDWASPGSADIRLQRLIGAGFAQLLGDG